MYWWHSPAKRSNIIIASDEKKTQKRLSQQAPGFIKQYHLKRCLLHHQASIKSLATSWYRIWRAMRMINIMAGADNGVLSPGQNILWNRQAPYAVMPLIMNISLSSRRDKVARREYFHYVLREASNGTDYRAYNGPFVTIRPFSDKFRSRGRFLSWWY